MNIRAAGDPDDLELRRKVKEIVSLHAATNPHWQEILHVVAPDAAAGRVAGGVVEVKLELKDKSDTVLGATVVKVELSTDRGLEHRGPFTLEPIGATLVGGVRTVFLVDDKPKADATAVARRQSDVRPIEASTRL